MSGGVEITTSHDPADWRHALEDAEPGPELRRIRQRVGAALNSGRDDAVVAVVLSEAGGWRARALTAEEQLRDLVTRHRLCFECWGTRIGCLAAPIKCCPDCRHPGSPS